MPTFNRANLISEAIDSIINQSFINWELIIIDDGSTDNTNKIIEKYTSTDSRIKYFYQQNSERSIARNNGIKISIGEYICFIDSDDLYEFDNLSNFYVEIKENNFPKSLFTCNISHFQNGQLKKIPIDNVKNYNNPIEFILLTNPSIIPSRVCIHKKILEEDNFNTALTISEDTELFSRILLKYKLIQTKNYGAVYRLHLDNSTNFSNNSYKEQLKSLKILFNNNKLRKKISFRTKYQKLSLCYLGIAKYHLNENSKILMRYYLLVSFFHNPFAYNTKLKIFLFLYGKPKF